MRWVDTQTNTQRAKSDDATMGDAETWEQEEDECKALESIEAREAREDYTLGAQRSNGSRSSNGTIAEHKHKTSRSSNGTGGPMTTGCVPCLIVGIPCDPNNPSCKRAMSRDWGMNDGNSNYDDGLKSIACHRVPLASPHSDQTRNGDEIGARDILSTSLWLIRLRRWRASSKTPSGPNVFSTPTTNLSYSTPSLLSDLFTSQYFKELSRTRRRRPRPSSSR